MTTSQCHGITTKGQRCKIGVSNDGKYCHYHIKQDSSQKTFVRPRSPNPPYVVNEYHKGFIYVYTLKHLVSDSPKKQDWLQIKKLSKGEDNSKWKIFNPKKYILIKIGLTTGTVTQRLRQWESKCNHSLVYVDPYVKYGSSSLSSLFSKLTVSKTKRHLKYYDPENHGFYTKNHLSKIEKSIHHSLWKLYGRGDIVCHGCSNDVNTRGHGIHVEWFMIERNELNNVFKIIDHVCQSYASA